MKLFNGETDMTQKTQFYLIILSLFSSFLTTKSSNQQSSHFYKTSEYYVACCPENCCCAFCYCDCNSCDQKPCVSWDQEKHRLGFCIYMVLEASGRNNEKRGCACSCHNSHYTCVNSGITLKNCIGKMYDRIRHCKCPGASEKVSCDCFGCCIRLKELPAEPVLMR